MRVTHVCHRRLTRVWRRLPHFAQQTHLAITIHVGATSVAGGRLPRQYGRGWCTHRQRREKGTQRDASRIRSAFVASVHDLARRPARIGSSAQPLALRLEGKSSGLGRRDGGHAHKQRASHAGADDDEPSVAKCDASGKDVAHNGMLEHDRSCCRVLQPHHVGTQLQNAAGGCIFLCSLS